MSGVPSMHQTGGYTVSGSVMLGAEVVAKWSSGKPLVSRGSKDGRSMVALYLHPISSAQRRGLLGPAPSLTSRLRNAVVYSACSSSCASDCGPGAFYNSTLNSTGGVGSSPTCSACGKGTYQTGQHSGEGERERREGDLPCFQPRERPPTVKPCTRPCAHARRCKSQNGVGEHPPRTRAHTRQAQGPQAPMPMPTQHDIASNLPESDQSRGSNRWRTYPLSPEPAPPDRQQLRGSNRCILKRRHKLPAPSLDKERQQTLNGSTKP